MRYVSGLAVRGLFILGLAVFAWQTQTIAQDSLVPAGTLLHCTLQESNFSSATAAIGDPVLCQLSSLQEFGRTVFPRGSYLQGHLEADKDPGHFAGKGYIRLAFDRIGLPDADVPVPIKIVSARGYRVDRDGDIMGHGHPKRDTAEWLFPPLWPWKVISLPARGPRPVLKGEEQLTLRLMEDALIPRTVAGRLGGYSGLDQQTRTYARPAVSFSYGPIGIGTVRLETPVKDAEVFVDGGYAGTVSQLRIFRLRAGEHEIEMLAPAGYLVYQDRVDVPLGKTLTITP